MFSVHTTPVELKNATVIGHFEFVVDENSVGEITRYYRDAIVCMPRFQNVSVHTNGGFLWGDLDQDQ